jgi:hypothetical protein
LTADSPDVTKNKGLGWNPFQPLEDEQQARSAARSGAIVSGGLVLSYVVQVAFVYGYNQDTFGNEGSIVLVMDVIAVVLRRVPDVADHCRPTFLGLRRRRGVVLRRAYWQDRGDCPRAAEDERRLDHHVSRPVRRLDTVHPR